MTVVTHARDSRSRSSGHRDVPGVDAARLVMVKRMCLGVLVTLVGGVILAGMIAIETAVYLQAVDF